MKIFGNKAADVVEKVAEEAGETARTFSSKEQGTRRQEIDMLSDNTLSKNVRPMTLIWLLILLTAMTVLNWFGIDTNEDYRQLITWALLMAIGFYFPGRDIIKAYSRKNK